MLTLCFHSRARLQPVMFAYRLFKKSGAVDPSIVAQWDSNLEKMNPWKDFGFPGNNWGLVGAAGDLLRTQLIAQFGNTSWSDAMLAKQFTPPDVYTQITGASRKAAGAVCSRRQVCTTHTHR